MSIVDNKHIEDANVTHQKTGLTLSLCGMILIIAFILQIYLNPNRAPKLRFGRPKLHIDQEADRWEFDKALIYDPHLWEVATLELFPHDKPTHFNFDSGNRDDDWYRHSPMVGLLHNFAVRYFYYYIYPIILVHHNQGSIPPEITRYTINLLLRHWFRIRKVEPEEFMVKSWDDDFPYFRFVTCMESFDQLIDISDNNDPRPPFSIPKGLLYTHIPKSPLHDIIPFRQPIIMNDSI